MRFNSSVRLGLLCIGGGLLLVLPAAAQVPYHPFTIASEAAHPCLDFALRQVLKQAQVLSPTELRSSYPALSFGQGNKGFWHGAVPRAKNPCCVGLIYQLVKDPG